MDKKCETCIKRKTMFCPNSKKCMAADDKPYYQNKIMLLEENQELKKKLEEYKDKINWYENFEVNKTIDKLRLKHNTQQKEFIDYLEDNWKQTQDIWYIKILQKYKEITSKQAKENDEILFKGENK